MEEAQAKAALQNLYQPGWPVRSVSDPYALEVQRAIGAAIGVPLLPAYVRRAHDDVLEAAANEALAGRSRLVVLVGSSSTGKTRACWEAVQRLPDSWGLWHPIDGHVDALLAGLPHVAAHTAIWLNEMQEYLLAPAGERAASGLRELLRAPGRGPVLVLGTIHGDFFNRLLTSHHRAERFPNIRTLLTGTGTTVPDVFVADPSVLQDAAAADRRWAESLAHADGGRFTQYLAGVPLLVDRFDHASPLATCLILAAAELRRLGHGPALPLPLLESTAALYALDSEWDELARPGWLSEALAYLTEPCRGIPGPLTEIRPRPGQPIPAHSRYKLSPYLEEVLRYELRHECPPAAFWVTALEHAETDADRRALSSSAHKRGRVRLSALGEKQDGNGYAGGFEPEAQAAEAHAELARIAGQRSSGELTDGWLARSMLHEAQLLENLGRDEEAEGILRQLALDGHVEAFCQYGDKCLDSERRDEAEYWYRRGAENGDPDAMQGVAFLLAENGVTEEAVEWTERVVEAGDIYAYSRLAYQYQKAGNRTEAKRYFRKAIDAGLVDCYQELIRLHKREGDRAGARRLQVEAVEAGETMQPMMHAESRGNYDQADTLVFKALDRGTVQPLRRLLWIRLQYPDLAPGIGLASKAIDAGVASVVYHLVRDLARTGCQDGPAAIQRLFAEIDAEAD
ncbi:hypothetical protein AB0K43_30080 [Kitasatospora sp. NPDC049258]|uniref:tetratricopeptide repeat protein n=1 Tax=Kitasatospora sp. NPDC049258 TaxID=3155394 RepID=UPI003438AE64